MKVPNKLLNAGSGNKSNGVALFAAVMVAFATLSGLIWGLYTKLAAPTDVACPSKCLPMKARSIPCDSCGMG